MWIFVGKKLISVMSKFLNSMFDGKMGFTLWKIMIENVCWCNKVFMNLWRKNHQKEMKEYVWRTMPKNSSGKIIVL